MASSLGSMLLVAASCAAVAAEAPREKRIASRDWYAAATVAEAAIDRVARSDWPGLLALMTPEAAAESDAALEQVGVVRDVLGPFQYALLADPIAEISPTCHERRYALAHEKHLASLSMQVCGEGESWAIGHFSLVPSMAAQASRLVTHVMAEKLAVKFYPPSCVDPSSFGSLAEFSCWATTHGGQTLELQLRPSESGVTVAAVEHAGKAPRPSRELLEPLARTALTQMTAGRHAELREAASVQFQDATDAKQLAASLAGFAEQPDSSPRIEWVDLDTKLVAPIVRLKLVREDGAHEVHLQFVPDRGQWRLLRFDFGVGEFAERLLRERALLDYLVRSLTHDPNATIRCPERSARTRDGTVMCDATAHGRRIEVANAPVAGKPGRVNLSTSDFATLLRMRLARLESELGWTTTDVACAEAKPTVLSSTSCRVGSPQGDRVLSVVNRGNDLRVIDLRRLPTGKGSSGD